MIDEEPLYTEEVRKLMYQTKANLPNDFPLVTRTEDDVYIIITIDMRHFDYRPVEGPGGRLEIAIELEKLRTSIESLGIGCAIEKVVSSG